MAPISLTEQTKDLTVSRIPLSRQWALSTCLFLYPLVHPFHLLAHSALALLSFYVLLELTRYILTVGPLHWLIRLLVTCVSHLTTWLGSLTPSIFFSHGSPYLKLQNTSSYTFDPFSLFCSIFKHLSPSNILYHLQSYIVIV